MSTARPPLKRLSTTEIVRVMRQRPPRDEAGGASKAARSFCKRCVKPLVIVPTILLCTFASLALLPESARWYGSPGLLTWSEQPSTHNGSVPVVHFAICPRPTICSEGLAQIILIAIARLSGYSLYVALGLAMGTKCYCMLYALRNTLASEYVPLQWVHELHRLAGIIFLIGSIVHTIAHLVRWVLRDGVHELHLMLLHPTGVSGVISVLLLLIAVLPMWKPAWFKYFKLSFEARHWMHLCVVPMGIVLCWHHTNILRFCVALFGEPQHQHPKPAASAPRPCPIHAGLRECHAMHSHSSIPLADIICAHELVPAFASRSAGMWGLDRSYLFFFKTRRVEDVAFMRLADGSVQMRWRNQRGVHYRAGEYVRISARRPLEAAPVSARAAPQTLASTPALPLPCPSHMLIAVDSFFSPASRA